MKVYVVKFYWKNENGVWEFHFQQIDTMSDALNWVAYVDSCDDMIFDGLYTFVK